MTIHRTTFIEPASPAPTRSEARRDRRRSARLRRTALVATAAAAVGALTVGSLAAAPDSASAATWVTAGTVAADAFNRADAPTLGSADVGGKYLVDTTRNLAVDDGTGVFTLASGGSHQAFLGDLPTSDTQSSVSVVVPTLPTSGNGVYVALQSRTDGKSYYQSTLRIAPSGTASLWIVRVNENTSVQKRLAEEIPVATGLTAGKRVRLDFRVFGDTTVGVQARAYLAGTSAPDWQRTGEDSSAQRVGDGGVGLWSYLSSGSKALSVAVDDLAVESLKTQTTAPAPAPAPAAGTRGAAAIGSTSYAVPSGAVFVAAGARNDGNGSQGAPFPSLTRAIEASPSGSTIVIRGGTYHESNEVPAGKRLTIQSYPGEAVWFDGTSSVGNFSQNSNRWVSGGWTVNFDSSPTFVKGASDGTDDSIRFVQPGHPMAAHPEQVWVGGVELDEVRSEGEVRPGTFYTDTAGDRLVIGSDPSGKSVRASTLQTALQVKGAGTVVRGIGFRNYGNSVWHMGAVSAQANDIRFENLAVTGMATIGVYTWGSNVTFDRLTLTDNGMMGGGANNADNFTLTSSSLLRNNDEYFGHTPVSGGFKITRSRVVTFTNNDFVGNSTNGLWLDESIYDARITGNRATDNGESGMTLELAEKITLSNNVLARNRGSGLLVQNTGALGIWNNTVVDNSPAQLEFRMDQRRQTNLGDIGHDRRQPLPDMTVPWITKNVTVANNVISSNANNACLVCIDDISKKMSADQMNFTFQSNAYQRSGDALFLRWSQGGSQPLMFSSLSAFQNAKGQDSRSQFFQGEGIVTSTFALTSSAASRTAGLAISVVDRIAAALGLSSGQNPGYVGARIR